MLQSSCTVSSSLLPLPPPPTYFLSKSEGALMAVSALRKPPQNILIGVRIGHVVMITIERVCPMLKADYFNCSSPVSCVWRGVNVRYMNVLSKTWGCQTLSRRRRIRCRDHGAASPRGTQMGGWWRTGRNPKIFLVLQSLEHPSVRNNLVFDAGRRDYRYSI